MCRTVALFIGKHGVINNILIQWGQINLIAGQSGTITLPITYIQNIVSWCCKINGNYGTSVSVFEEQLSQVTVINRYYPGVPEGTACRAFTIGV